MTAAVHVAFPHHPLATFSTWLREHFHRRPAAGALAQMPPEGAYFEAVRRSFPVDVQDYRHALENPGLEDAFARLAADHPVEVAVAAMRDVDRQQQLLAVVDDWFRHAHPAPMHRWSAQELALYEQLLVSVRACFRPAGGAR